MKIATNIKTEVWNRIIHGLVKEGWTIRSKYDAFDAGIDFDFLILKKGKHNIFFGWDNWTEGEIKCTNELMEELGNKFNLEFKFGAPQNLKTTIIVLTRIQNCITNLGKRLFD